MSEGGSILCTNMVKKYQKSKNDETRGSILVFVIVFCAVFMMIGVSLIQIMSLLHKSSLKKQSLEKTFQVAEAGINFYKWRLAHSPDDYTGSGDYEYKDNNGNRIGYYHLDITEPPLGSTVVTATSTGYIDSDPNISRTLEARLAIPALSDYAFLTNSNAWIGESEEIVGKMHSNGGIRFDGESDSTVDSPLATYICGPEHGCSYEEHDGVWGTGVIQELWRFPPTHSITSIDFNEIILDLADMKTKGQSAEGEYFGDSGEFGWYLHFDYDTATFKAYKVTDVYWTYGWDFTDGWQWRGIDIKSLGPEQAISLPANGVIFVEDQVWVDGEVDKRLTVASADFTDPNKETSIIINEDIVYENRDGSSAMGLIAQKDVLIPLYSPEKLEVDAALLAQGGHCFRYYYPESWYGADAIKDEIEIWGSVITNTIWTWSWVSSETGPVVSGYDTTETTYDPYLTYGPPPEFPTSGEYEVITWREVK